MRRTFFALAVSAALATGTLSMPAAAQRAGAADMTPNGRGAYVTLAGAFHLFEYRAAEMAKERARSPEVREFARAAAESYQQRVDALLAAASAAGVEDLPPAMLPMQWDMLRQLERASDRRFESRYVDQQIRAHELSLAMHRNYAANGDAAPLREAAQAAAEVANDHLETLRPFDR